MCVFGGTGAAANNLKLIYNSNIATQTPATVLQGRDYLKGMVESTEAGTGVQVTIFTSPTVVWSEHYG